MRDIELIHSLKEQNLERQEQREQSDLWHKTNAPALHKALEELQEHPLVQTLVAALSDYGPDFKNSEAELSRELPRSLLDHGHLVLCKHKDMTNRPLEMSDSGYGSLVLSEHGIRVVTRYSHLGWKERVFERPEDLQVPGARRNYYKLPTKKDLAHYSITASEALDQIREHAETICSVAD